MIKPKTDDVWENNANGHRVIVSHLWDYENVGDMVKIFDTYAKEWYNISVNSFTASYKLID